MSPNDDTVNRANRKIHTEHTFSQYYNKYITRAMDEFSLFCI